MQLLRSRRTRVRLLWLAVAAVALLSLPRFVTVGAPFDPSLFLGFLALVLRAAFWLWLVLLLLPGLTGWARRTGGRSGWGWSSRRVAGRTRRGAGRPIPPSAPYGGPPAVWPVGSPPVFSTVHVAPSSVRPGEPVTVSWQADNAEEVALGDRTGLPAHGSASLVPTSSGPLHLTALNRHGTSSSSTQSVHVGAPRRIDLTAVPAPPPVPTPSPVSPARLPELPPAPLLRLDLVVAQQQARRSTTTPSTAPGASQPDLTPDPAARRPR